MMDKIVGMDWVLEHLQDENVRLIDCRFLLGQPQAGREAYRKDHIPNAFYFDLEQDLSGPIQKHGGRHPLPAPATLAQKLGKIGIDENVHVIAYDDQGGAMASRLWWLLAYLGHEKASVMNGTYAQWKANGYPTTSAIPTAHPRSFHVHLQNHLIASMEEVKQKLHSPQTLLLDSREEKRYLGEEEPIDSVAGHIPGARHCFWKGVLQENGTWKNPDELKQHFAQLPPAEELIVYCGSGVTAAPNVLALQAAGYKNVKLYAGSWSDWISYKENPVARGKENEV